MQRTSVVWCTFQITCCSKSPWAAQTLLLHSEHQKSHHQGSLAVAKSVGKGPYFAKKICHLVMYIGHFHTLLPARSGKLHAHLYFLNNEQIFQAVHYYLTVQEIREVKFQHTFKVTRITKYNYLLHKVTPLKLMHEVNQTIIPALGFNLGKTMISKNCTRRWLKKLGYKLTAVKKGHFWQCRGGRHLMMPFHPHALRLAACEWYFHIRLIFLLKSLTYKPLLKLQAISAISCLNFTVSLILLKCTGDGSKYMSIWRILHCLSRLFWF